MTDDKDKLLQVIASLESDYSHGKISREKYLYFRSKYEDKLNSIDAIEATNRIRSMQGKPQEDENPPEDLEYEEEKREKEDLVQKYIINPKKGDTELKEKVPMSSGTFMLIAMLVLIVGFAVGVGFGIFSLDSDSLSNTNVSATVIDTAFPDVADVSSIINETAGENFTNVTGYDSTYSEIETVEEAYNVPTSYETPQSSDTGGEAPEAQPQQGGGGEAAPAEG